MRKISIPEGCTNIVIFVHGFGVRWDSRGIFTDIAENLPDGWGSVLFDLYDIDGDNVRILSISDQAKRVQTTYKEISELHPGATIHLIAHSMGCIVAIEANLNINGRLVLLAPPSTFGGGALEEYFTQYPGAEKQADKLVVPRKDGTISHIPYTFFKQMAQTDPIETVSVYAEQHQLVVMAAEDDELVDTTKYASFGDDTKIISIPGDHNFTDKHRGELIACIQKELI
ncbi:alpha/beta hydrolase [Candidatus Saccharibacteria bacterium]|nr:alpha/beta hydrolase [Candidatus Saccharibacteria bacterium]